MPTSPLVVEIDDPADPRVADYQSLSDVDLRVRYEGEAGVFIAEGPLVVRQLLSSPYAVRSVLVAPNQLVALQDALRQVTAPVYVAAQPVIDSIAGFHLHRGALACGARSEPDDLDSVLASTRTIAVIERVNDHENLGAIYRSARALGVDAVLLCPECCDPLYRRSVRVSMGHVLHVPTARVGPISTTISELRERGFRTVALTPDGTDPVSVLGEYAADERIALLVGAEGPGLRDSSRTAADRRVRIPMTHGVDSLNVATAAAIAFHELAGRAGATSTGDVSA